MFYTLTHSLSSLTISSHLSEFKSISLLMNGDVKYKMWLLRNPHTSHFRGFFCVSIKEWLFVTTTIGMNRRWRRKNVYSQLMLLTYYYCCYSLLIYVLSPLTLALSRARLGCSINSVNKHFTKSRSTKKE